AILTNDSDADGDPLTARVVSGPTNGSLGVLADGSLKYTPNAGFHGTDIFTYVATDGLLNGNIATVTIDVTFDANPVLQMAPVFVVDQGVASPLTGLKLSD